MNATDFDAFFEKYKHEGITYQPALHDFCVRERPGVLVETGSGASTLFMARAMQDGQFGHLYSIDPAPWCGYSVEHPRITNIRQKSYDVLAALYTAVNPWDLFLHDSNHDLECQSWELAVAYEFLRPGGWLWCDDYGWAGHGAWDRFALGKKTHHFASCEAVQKPLNHAALPASEACDFAESIRKACRIQADAWRAAGHPDTPCFANQ